jgi:hypothetical protein
MLRLTLAAGAFALSLAMPAFAQNTMSGPSPSAMKASDTSMSCNQMMAKASSMATHATGAARTMAQNQMSQARMAKAKGDDAGCKMHTEKAMGYMK